MSGDRLIDCPGVDEHKLVLGGVTMRAAKVGSTTQSTKKGGCDRGFVFPPNKEKALSKAKAKKDERAKEA